MPVELDPIYLVYLLVAVSAGMFFEGMYLLCFSGASYRSNVNRRLKLLKNESNREALLVQLPPDRVNPRSRRNWTRSASRLDSFLSNFRRRLTLLR